MSRAGSLPLVFCQAAGTPVALEARLVKTARLAHAPSAAEDFAQLVGLSKTSAHEEGGPWQILHCQNAGALRQLAVHGPLEIREQPLSALFPLPPLLAARCQLRGLRALLLPEAGKNQNCTLIFALPDQPEKAGK